MKLSKGDSLVIDPQIHIIGTGKETYLWIGDDSDNKSTIRCFATKSGPKTLEKFAKEILKAISKV